MFKHFKCFPELAIFIYMAVSDITGVFGLKQFSFCVLSDAYRNATNLFQFW